jgi:hypothetical protein
MPLPHWNSRFLTKDWEVNVTAERQLVFYDFMTGESRPTSSRVLFRENYCGRDEALEKHLKALIETPIADALPAPRLARCQAAQAATGRWSDGRRFAFKSCCEGSP